MIGTAHILKRRAATPELGEQIEKLVNNQEKKVRQALGKLAGMVMAAGNIEGGLSSTVARGTLATSLHCPTMACSDIGKAQPGNQV